MKHSQNDDNEPDYTALSSALLDKYGPLVRKSVETTHLPDEIVDSDEKSIAGDLVIRDRYTGERVADIGYVGTGELIITVPADYTPPMHRYPFEDIDEHEDLPSSGELIYDIMNIVSCIIVSTYPEVTHKRKLISLVKELHQNHSYSPDDICEGLVTEAQNRGDLPDKNN
jgi:hypothetical protein